MMRENLIVCPVYNEQETINEFYHKIRDFYGEDILFIDDGSTDKSTDFLLKIKDTNTFFLRHHRRQGYGAALDYGFRFALEKGYGKVVTIDADLQHNPEHIFKFFRELTEYEVVLGSRYIRIDKYFDVPLARLVINRYISGLMKVLFSADFTDPFCGYRGYRNSFLKKTHFSEKSYGFGLEILLEMIILKVPFKEIPIEAIYFNPQRTFLDGLDNSCQRLLYYLAIISRKRKKIKDEKAVSFC